MYVQINMLSYGEGKHRMETSEYSKWRYGQTVTYEKLTTAKCGHVLLGRASGYPHQTSQRI